VSAQNVCGIIEPPNHQSRRVNFIGAIDAIDRSDRMTKLLRTGVIADTVAAAQPRIGRRAVTAGNYPQAAREGARETALASLHARTTANSDANFSHRSAHARPWVHA
jgi:hypothetical protein